MVRKFVAVLIFTVLFPCIFASYFTAVSVAVGIQPKGGSSYKCDASFPFSILMSIFFLRNPSKKLHEGNRERDDAAANSIMLLL